MLTLLRLPAILLRIGVSKPTYHRHVAAGLMVPPISIGPRMRATPAHEIDAILAARVSGKSEEELKALVLRLLAQRQHADVAVAAPAERESIAPQPVTA